MGISEIRNMLTEKGLRVTPQRVAIYDAILKLNNHPTAEEIVAYIITDQPHIATGTVYKVLDSLVDNNLVVRVTTEKDNMRYDAITENHHHLYCVDSDRISDYHNNEINELLADYFSKHTIPGFEIADIKLQIKGKFKS